MDLSAYFSYKKTTIPEAAKSLGVSVETVRSWLKGIKVPRRAQMRALYRWSGGMVDANSFCGLPDPDLLHVDIHKAAHTTSAEICQGRVVSKPEKECRA